MPSNIQEYDAGGLYLSIMHCSLPVISLLTCCQKEVLKACTCLYSQAARHSGILSPPSGHKHYLADVPGLEHFLAKDPPPPPGHEHFLAYQCEVNIQIAFLFIIILSFFLRKIIIENKKAIQILIAYLGNMPECLAAWLYKQVQAFILRMCS